MTNSDGSIEATLIPGDGIGPEITEAVLFVLDALGVPFAWDRQDAGMTAYEKGGNPLPEAVLASIRRTGLALKGPLTTPVAGGFRSATVQMREAFDLYANVRPARTLVPGRYDHVDIVLIRENLEGLYLGQETYLRVGDDQRAVAIVTAVNTHAGSRRIAEFAFDYAVRMGRRKVTVVHKANVLKVVTGIFLDAAREVSRAYEGRIEFHDQIIDACAMNLVLDPAKFDVIVTTNLFGDILSDEIAGLVGGLGMAPGANIGKDAAIFEAVHGSAPDIAGKGVANPLAMLMAAGLMLRHIDLVDKAERLDAGIRAALDSGARTRDIGGTLGTMDLARAIAEKLSA